MLYNQPFGVSDPNAAYINGNPATGTMGSIPPAASIEFDQREIVAVIQYAFDKGLIDFNNVVCKAPANTDLTQLLKAIFGIANKSVGKLFANVVLYVNPATGNDAWDGSAAAHGSGSVGPFATFTKALTVVSQFLPGTFGATINLAAGTYVGPFYSNNWAHCNVTINGAGPTTIISVTGGQSIGFGVYGPNNYALTNMAFASTSNYAGYAHVYAGIGAICNLNGGILLGGITTAQQPSALYASGTIVIGGSLTLNGSMGYAGHYGGFIVADGSGGSVIFGISVPILVPAPVSCAYFVQAVVAAVVSCAYGFPPIFPNGVSPGNVTGVKYIAELNGVMYTQQNVVFPGDSPGFVTLGGQYS